MYLVHPEHPSQRTPKLCASATRHRALRWPTFRAANGLISERRAHDADARHAAATLNRSGLTNSRDKKLLEVELRKFHLNMVANQQESSRIAATGSNEQLINNA